MINRFVFTFISTSWILVVYGIEQKCSYIFNSFIVTSIIMGLTPFLLTFVWLIFARWFSVDNIAGGCEDIEEAQDDYLANYLGYVFIGIGVNDILVLVMVYVIIFVLTFAVQNKCFNPVLLIFGFKYYNVTTTKGTKVFIVTREKLRTPDDVEFNNLRRINNMSYIEIRR